MTFEEFEEMAKEVYSSHLGLGLTPSYTPKTRRFSAVLSTGRVGIKLMLHNFAEHPNFRAGQILSVEGIGATSSEVFQRMIDLIEEKFQNGNINRSRREQTDHEEQEWQ